MSKKIDETYNEPGKIMFSGVSMISCQISTRAK